MLIHFQEIGARMGVTKCELLLGCYLHVLDLLCATNLKCTTENIVKGIISISLGQLRALVSSN